MSKTSILSALSQPANSKVNDDNHSSLYGAKEACRDVANEILANVKCDEIELLLFHTSTLFDLDTVAKEISARFPHVNIVGCTSAGEFNKNGYGTEKLLAVAFLKNEFSIATALVPNLGEVNFDEAHDIASGLRRALQGRERRYDTEQHFVISVLDGLTRHEEHFLETFATAFGNIPHLGGSAGDDLKLEATYVFYNGEFHRDAAVLLLVGTGKPFTVFSIDHINSPVSKLVVTHADPESRTVYEINGEPAAQYYASLLGMKAEDLTPDVFSMFPLAVMVGGKYFIRSIQKVDLATNAITFYCAVDIGIILTFVQLGDCIEALESKLDKLRAQLGEPEFVYACDCFLRRLEIQQGKNDHEIRRLQQRYNVAGFNAYGEHIHSVHLNQTFTGVYFAAQ
ncbi:FIST C-terminal domain-containing protein [Alteromonas sp. DY56-G5]|uniref:nitric oxide-sensing protein NosP n=1 Tax=Alteromonas TaxID=226 RepID=UPI000286FCEF|nr:MULTISPECIES: nitric oxide-sensing protein NosP [Alteromonas]MCG7638300.1 FIST C-terminal domain-containing protein [Alteromonas sp. CNT1-28]MCG7643201.1 FIST C-terminal domain-containing protein [Alteromonas sp. MmMcT2-2]MCG7646535.1 FIST C-terminal domain-containing protein [Alteromonas sp. Cnat3-28]MCG7650334.1 FIST C-terminal domain-containing protein [Alteromonas sp. MmMcT2-5]MCG7652805.1 FIST C-terminal domain-containing protein [Alteromonas sp. Cnat2-8]MCG7813940.1 FIST C-terminal d